MSRVCVKNLPKYVAEDRLREYFSQKGEITDAKLMRTKYSVALFCAIFSFNYLCIFLYWSEYWILIAIVWFLIWWEIIRDGNSRQFAFVGFRTEREAEEAINYFNKSYLDTCRITCELARSVGDPNIPRPWSRHSSKNEEKKISDVTNVTGARNSSLTGAKGERKKSAKGDDIDDPRLQEFLQVMQPRTKSKLWANDALISPSVDLNSKVEEKQTQEKKEGPEKSAPVYVETKEKNTDATKKSHNVAHDEAISDMDYFKTRVRKEWSDSESDKDDDDDDDDDDDTDSDSDSDDDDDDDDDDEDGDDDVSHKASLMDEDGQNVEPGREAARTAIEGPSEDSDGEKNLEPGNPSLNFEDERDEVLENDRLFVRNLPYAATEDDLQELFSKFGSISQVHVVVDKDTKRSKGIAYIQYALPESASRALEDLDNSIFQGRLLHVMPAKQRNPSNKEENNVPDSHASKTLKQRREQERKASEANGNTRSWNSLFMRPDTVVENIARKLGVSKSDLLDREADDLAVRIALGETRVITETKKALANAGVNVTRLEEFAAGNNEGMKRSNHVLLVKNLPYGSSESELASMFGKFGSLDKIILPPTKTLALVVFLEPAEARAAFKGLAYKRYKDAPLYLEWAPGDILSQNSASESDNVNAVVGERDPKLVMLEQHVEGISDMDMDPDRVESRSLFVKNLNFKTSDESLKEHFREHLKEGEIMSVKVKKHLKNGKNVSMGFGFMEFDCVETAANVCRDLQGTILDGHALNLQLCHAKKDEQVVKRVDKDKSLTKLLVKNVAFEATEKDLRQLFSPFGQIKSLRLPTKLGNHRGFAFVEYITKQEAQNALQALSNTHLYGRHLVLERAKEGESLEELRARTAAQFTNEQNGFQNPTKLSRKRKHMALLDEGKMKFERIGD
ncbi:multiple RNA-binding domain-containing protein 1-like isoform X2 [Tripterygium wilfordii]|uniref:Multiple RNA-binding domain-containing protein 1-like isoform X2 n=1 Tax=Tripterygium wilfordii TaxID=458696 RepID=A0A7J7E2I7_TRIWF|nr:multiple RNA-binding domain-containing protein 1-like isoform X2 [Tripterygium wilfordii]